jgi:Holliday junction resolvasome RuvABC DNA-binding subunit
MLARTETNLAVTERWLAQLERALSDRDDALLKTLFRLHRIRHYGLFANTGRADNIAPDRLREVDGIGPVRASRITAAWAEQKVVREIMVFLHSHGVGTAGAVRIYKTYGPDAIQVMTENPYRLARDIRGIGFKTADAIAMKLGIEKTALVRVRAGISYALTEAMDEGHCGLPTEELIPLAEKLLEVPPELIRTALDLELQEGTVIADRVGETPCVFLAGLHRAERTKLFVVVQVRLISPKTFGKPSVPAFATVCPVVVMRLDVVPLRLGRHSRWDRDIPSDRSMRSYRFPSPTSVCRCSSRLSPW